MQTEDITGRVVSAADSTENDVSPVVGIRPVDHIVLPVNSDIEAGEWHGGEIAFPLSRKGKALPMNKIDLPIKSRHGNPFHLADTTEWNLVDEKTENSCIFVGSSVPDRRRRNGNECPAARLATIAYRSCFCSSEQVVVCLAFLNAYMVIGAVLVWA
jgi:hypothetical protein